MYNSLKVSILISEKCEIPSWEHALLKRLLDKQLTDQLTFVLGAPEIQDKGSLAYRLFNQFENKWFRSVPDALKPVKLKEMYPGAAFRTLEDHKNLNPDLVYISCTADIKNQPDRVPEFGIWSLVLGNGPYKNTVPPVFWEVMNDEIITGSSLLVQLPGKNNPITVYEGSTATAPYSVKNSLNILAWKSASYFMYRLNELLLLGTTIFYDKYQSLEKVDNPDSDKHRKPPGNFQMLWLFTRNIARYFRYRLLKKKEGRFCLLYVRKKYTGGNLDTNEFIPVSMPANVFHADPFIMSRGGIDYIFFEEYAYATGKGHISMVKLDNNGIISSPEIVLERPYHLSYPFVFEWQGETYMIPETSANNTVELYKARNFPFQWDLVCNLLDNINLLDVTLLYENETWWLFGNAADIPFTSTNDQLLLFYKKDLFSGNWIPHPQNPVATQIGNCRPAGKIFRQEGQLFRPAQNNASRQYGFGVVINQIKRLNETEYLEEQVSSIRPGKDNSLLAVHTFNFSDSVVIVDAVLKKKRP